MWDQHTWESNKIRLVKTHFAEVVNQRRVIHVRCWQRSIGLKFAGCEAVKTPQQNCVTVGQPHLSKSLTRTYVENWRPCIATVEWSQDTDLMWKFWSLNGVPQQHCHEMRWPEYRHMRQCLDRLLPKPPWFCLSPQSLLLNLNSQEHPSLFQSLCYCPTEVIHRNPATTNSH